ncbi:MAG: ATP-binding protein [Bacteroidota bacterium]
MTRAGTIRLVARWLLPVGFVGTLQALAAQEAPFSIADQSRAHCPVCRWKTKPTGTEPGAQATLFHRFHQDLRARQYDSLHLQLQQAIDARTFGNADTLVYFTQLMQARVLDNLELPVEALEAYRLAWRSGHRMRLPHQDLVQADIARVQQALGEYAAALDRYRSVMTMPGFSSNGQLANAVYNGMGVCYLLMDTPNYDSAAFYLQRSVAVQAQIGDSANMAVALLNLGSVYFDQYRDEEAIAYWLQSRELAVAHAQLDILDEVHYNLALAYESVGRSEQALTHYKRYVVYKDSIWNRDNLWELARQRREFEVRIREKEIRNLDQARALQASLARQKNQERNGMILLAGLALVVAALVIGLYRITLRKNHTIHGQKERLASLNATQNRLFSIVAHDLRSPLQALEREHQKMKPQKEMAKHATVWASTQQHIRTVGGLLNNLMHWALSQTDQLNLHFEALPLHRVMEQVAHDFQPLLVQKQLHFRNQIPPGASAVADAPTLKIVWRNVIDNAIKFTPELGTITCTAHEAGPDMVAVVIADTGPGMPEPMRTDDSQTDDLPAAGPDSFGHTSSGLGLQLCRDLMARNRGRMHIGPNTPSGTRVMLELPTIQ